MSSSVLTPDVTPSSRGIFPTTRWTVILRPESAEGKTAACGFWSQYSYALYVLARRLGNSPDDAKDLVQEVFQRVLRPEVLSRLDPQIGRFRGYLARTLRNLAVSKSRRPGFPDELVEAEGRYAAEPIDDRSPEKVYHEKWVYGVLNSVFETLCQEAQARNSLAQYEILRPYLIRSDELSSIESLSQELGISLGAVKMRLQRLRARFGELFYRTIADSVLNPEEVQSEVRWAISVLCDRPEH